MNIDQFANPALLIAIPLLSAVIIPVVGYWKKSLCYPFTLAALAGTTLTAIRLTEQVVGSSSGVVHYYMGGWEPPWGIALRIDHLSVMMELLVTIVALLVLIYAKKSIEKEIAGREVPFYSVVLLLVTGLLGIVSTGDMFNLYVFLEISSITGYALIALGSDKATFFTFRYLVVGTIGACFYLLGVGYLYSVTGTLNMEELATILPELYGSKVVMVSFAFFTMGMAIKMALFPLHFWLPAAYSLAPSAVSALIAPTMTKTAAYVLVRVMFTVFEPSFSMEVFPITEILGWMGAVAMIAGSVMAIAQSDLKWMLAYSSVAQVGYIVLGVGLANEAGLTGGLLHIVNHAFMKCTLFLVAGAIIYKTGIRDIKDFRGLYIKMPVTTFAFFVSAFSMIGIPPTCGFFSKVYLIMGAVDAEKWAFVGFILVSSILNLIYFINVVTHMYFPTDEGKDKTITGLTRDEAPLSMLVPMLVMALAIIGLGVFNGEIISNIISSAIPAGLGR
jgi:multicomponent Na+:H+ antiporter subunit D